MTRRALWPLYLVLAAYAAFALAPFGWMILTSFKEQRDLFRLPPDFRPTLLLGDDPWRNYAEVWTRRDFVTYFRNSLIVSGLAALGQVLTCTLAGYALARLRMPGRDVIFALVLATAFVPTEVTIIPEFLLMRSLGWIDTWAPLIVPSFLVGAFGTFLLREYFAALPAEYAEAARMDGANPWQVFWQIYLPMAQPAVVSVFTIAFINNWDEVLRPLVFLNRPELFTMPLGLMGFFSQYDAAWHLLMAGSVISVLPLVLIYVLTQRYVLQGFMGGGLR